MKKNRNDKIFDEIREKVLHKDLERKNEMEIKEMREANIEALTELTSLSRKEVEEITDQVKHSYLIREKTRQKRIVVYAVLGAISLIILYFIFRPEPELKLRIVEDDFSIVSVLTIG